MYCFQDHIIYHFTIIPLNLSHYLTFKQYQKKFYNHLQTFLDCLLKKAEPGAQGFCMIADSEDVDNVRSISIAL